MSIAREELTTFTKLLQTLKNDFGSFLLLSGLEKTNGDSSDHETGPLDDGNSDCHFVGMSGERTAHGPEGQPGDGPGAAGDGATADQGASHHTGVAAPGASGGVLNPTDIPHAAVTIDDFRLIQRLGNLG
jgi:hypothetical protein